jgi:hypothetical protein
MTNCPKCGRPMKVLLRRQGGQTHADYECLTCAEPDKKSPATDPQRPGG